ncbi:MAG: DNA adenine methylase [Acidobacteriaceae bacterium]|nr:DNA adenine methylase [Acidobacteriaceae bacterium]
MTYELKAPFPWFGGKSRVADIVWERFGNVPNYVEPFFGSGAVLLGRPHSPGTETVNDLDCYLANFWRSIKTNPSTTAAWADWPVNEADLLARHQWLVDQAEFKAHMRRDPEHCDLRIAGWWVWGICQWIGSGWCAQRGNGHQPEQLPHLGTAGMGINRKLPHLGDAGRGEAIAEYFAALSNRLRGVRVACGEWDRVLGDSVTVKHGITGVFLDPPYSPDEHSVTYSANSDVAAQVREWAIANGSNRDLRIALCGYEGEHALPDDWECVAWKARGGYGSQSEGAGRANASRERIWFSPNCLRVQEVLF